MANTYELIASYTATTAVSNITFTSIPATYDDLLLKVSIKVNQNFGYADNYQINFNGDFSTTYTMVLNYANGATAGTSFTQLAGMAYVYMPDTAATSLFTNTDFYIPSYRTTNNYKYASVDGNAPRNSTTNNILHMTTGVWPQASAINSVGIQEYANGLQLTANSSAYLYGIKKS